jgi:hypothetical protein
LVSDALTRAGIYGLTMNQLVEFTGETNTRKLNYTLSNLRAHRGYRIPRRGSHYILETSQETTTTSEPESLWKGIDNRIKGYYERRMRTLAAM